jgi:4-amino-4-deoxy-L-arabinose transferase-like glycosyltransferase
MSSRAGTKGQFATALLAGLALRALFVLHHARIGDDTVLYSDLAHNLLARHAYGFTTDSGIRLTLIRLPGYPLFLTACFAVFGTANYAAVLWAQAVMDLATCTLLGLLAGRLLGRRAAIATVWLAALCPFTAHYSSIALTECGCLFAAALAFFALERWLAAWASMPRPDARNLGWACLCGFGLIMGILFRPDQALIAVAIVPVILWVGLRRGQGNLLCRAAPTLAASLIIALPLGLWAARNWRVFRVVQPLAPRYATDPGEFDPAGFQRWYRTWAIDFKSTMDVYWMYDGGPIDMKDLPPRAFDSPSQRAETAALIAQYNNVTSATPTFDAVFARIAAEHVQAHPLRYYLLLPVARELDMWLRPRTELMKLPVDFWNVRVHPGASLAEFAYAALNLAYLLLAVAGFVRWRRLGFNEQGALAFAMVAFVALRCVLLLTLDNAEQRYTLECFPVIILLAGLFFARKQNADSRTCHPEGAAE